MAGILLNDRYTNKASDTADIESLTKFNSYFDNRYVDPFVKGYGFIFVTKPSLFIYPIKPGASGNSVSLRNMAYDNMCRDPFFSQYLFTEAKNSSDRLIIKQLSYEKDFKDPYLIGCGNLLPLFTNQLKSFDMSDITIDQIDAFESKQGYKMPLPTFKTASEGSGNLSIVLNETANMDFTKIFSIWVNYISNISDGTFMANPEFIRSRIIDYMCSIYYFCLAPDGQTIKYWSKYTGCWPTTIPAGNTGYDQGGFDSPQITASFNYTSREDMNPAILEDFNRVILNKTIEKTIIDTIEDYAPIHNSPYLNESKVKLAYSMESWGTNGTCPFIISTNSGSTSETSIGAFKLIFPVNIDSLYTTVKFGTTEQIYNDVKGNSIFTNDFILK